MFLSDFTTTERTMEIAQAQKYTDFIKAVTKLVTMLFVDQLENWLIKQNKMSPGEWVNAYLDQHFSN